MTLEERAAMNDKCECGHSRHRHHGLQGHGQCGDRECPCSQFTWVGFFSAEAAEELAREYRKERA
jgi:hypothetical protein